MSLGKISQVVGPVVDVAFSVGDKLPEINNALVVYKNDQQKSKVVLEVALELGDGAVSYTHLARMWLQSVNCMVQPIVTMRQIGGWEQWREFTEIHIKMTLSSSW